MGNVTTSDLPTEKQQGVRTLLDLSRKLNYHQYVKHVNNEDLNAGSLTALPWTLLSSVSLHGGLDASFNSVPEIPKDLPLHLPHLTYINLQYNCLTTLPDSISLFFHLRTLLLSHNQLQTLPASFIHLSKLQKLDLSHNCLTELPQDIGNLQALQRLNVSNNKLQNLPLSLGTSQTLQLLLAVSNKCCMPPQQVCNQGSDVTLKYLRTQVPNGVPSSEHATPKFNTFKRKRGHVLHASVQNPHCARSLYAQEQTHTTNTTSRNRTPLRPPPHGTKLHADTLMDRVLGLLYGAAIGDAIGIATELMTPDECRFHYNAETLSYSDIIRDKHRVRWRPGDWTTDFDQTLLLLESLLKWGGVVDELDFAQQLEMYCRLGFPELGDTEEPLVGNTIQRVLSDPRYLQDPHGAARRLCHKVEDQDDVLFEYCDNSCLTRTVVLGVPQFHDLKEVSANAIRICRATHHDPRCLATAVVLTATIALMLQGSYDITKDESMEELLQVSMATGRQHLSRPAHLKAFEHYCGLRDYKSIEVWAPHQNQMTFCFKTLAAGLVALRGKQDFRSAIMELVMLGGDSNTHASVTGALLGAYWGYRALPHDWLNDLPDPQASLLNMKANALLDMMGIP
ncbi:uncharacterized protein LOC144873163 [Branchiostoma floridae x Branchiostoma japonicum]